jgi:hypothetical protein
MASKWWTLTLLVVLVGCATSDSIDGSSSTSPTSTTIASPATTGETTATSATALTTTTTTAAPEPPRLEIIDPRPHAIITTGVYTFQGLTDPGCTIDVGGRYFADVDPDGNWTLDLVLRPGGNTTTLTATNHDGAKTALQVSVTYAPIVLSADGLGVVSFGDPMDDVMTVLTDLLGPPTSDEIYEDTWGEDAAHGYLRQVRWWGPSVKLFLEFKDWDINYTPLETPVFSYWVAAQGEMPLRTIEGVGPGTPWTEAAAIYGDRAQTSPEECEGQKWWNFAIDGDSGDWGHARFTGTLDGDPTNPETSIASMVTGVKAFPQGC